MARQVLEDAFLSTSFVYGGRVTWDPRVLDPQRHVVRLVLTTSPPGHHG